jgi:hypothetical protein
VELDALVRGAFGPSSRSRRDAGDQSPLPLGLSVPRDPSRDDPGRPCRQEERRILLRPIGSTFSSRFFLTKRARGAASQGRSDAVFSRRYGPSTSASMPVLR